MASNRSHPITVPQQLRWWSTPSLWERTTSTEGIIITVDSFRKHSPPSWPSLILSLTAVTFAISPQLVVGMSVPATGATQTPPAATAARLNSIESPSNFTNSVVDDDDGRLVDGGSQQARNANESQQSSDDVVIPTSLNVNLSAIPLIAGVTSAPGGGGGGGLQLPPGEVPRDAHDDNRTSSSALMASASTNETSSVLPPPPPPPPPTRPSISLLQGFLASIFCMLIVLTVIGNTLVILSVLTTRRLRTVTNCFVMSLAVADWLVGLFVMPPAVAVFLLDKWQLGRVLCDIWISLDVLLCTASILSLCAISIDRYLAVTQPLNYSRRRRSKRLALLMILVVWVLAVAITCPPMLGWYDSAERGSAEECHYNQNKAYVVYSAMGSFFIPMLVMIYVYVQISCVIARRHDHMSEIEVHKKGHRSKEADVAELDIDVDNVSEPEPSSPRRTGGGSSTMTTTTTTIIRAKQQDNNNNNNSSTNNCNRNQKNAQYELVGDVAQQPLPSAGAGRSMSTYRNSNNNNNSAADNNWYNSTSSSTNVPTQPLPLPTTSTKPNNIRVHQKSMSNRIMSLKRENKTTQTLAIVVGGFIACWLPFFIAYLVTPFLAKDAIDDGVSAFLTWLGWFNSAMNPFIYALYSVDFRAAFWRLTCRRFCKNMRKAPYASNTYSIRRT